MGHVENALEERDATEVVGGGKQGIDEFLGERISSTARSLTPRSMPCSMNCSLRYWANDDSRIIASIRPSWEMILVIVLGSYTNPLSTAKPPKKSTLVE